MKVDRIKVDCWKIGDLIVVYDDEDPRYSTIELYDYENNVTLNRDQAKVAALLILDILKRSEKLQEDEIKVKIDVDTSAPELRELKIVD